MLKIRIHEPFHPGPEPAPAHQFVPVDRTTGPGSDHTSAGTAAAVGTAGWTPADAVARHHIGTYVADHAQSAPPLLLPERYIGTPVGKLRPDPRQPDSVWFDETGQSYVRNGANFYAVSFDSGNHTWRAIQTGDRGKPGIPIHLGSGWDPHGDVGGPAGQPEKERLKQEHEKLSKEHSDGVSKKKTLLEKIAQLENDKREAEREVSSMTSGGLPDEIWGPNLSDARAEVSRIEGALSSVRSEADRLQSDLDRCAQQMENVLRQLLQTERQ